MTLGSPSIVGPVAPCCERIRVKNQLSGARVRVFVDGDPNPIGDLTVPWSDFEIPVDHTRLVVGKKVSASQELGNATSPKSPKGVSIQPVAFGTITFAKPLYVCGQSVLLDVQADPKIGAAAGSRIEIWQGSMRLGTGNTVGTLCRVDFDPNQRISVGAPLQAVQFICTSGSPQTTSSKLPVIPPTMPVRKMPPVELVRTDGDVLLFVECARLIKVRNIIPGATLRLHRRGAEIFNRPVPTDQESVWVGDGFAVHEIINADQSMIFCEFTSGVPDKVSVHRLTGLKRPRIDGPLCDGAGSVTVSRLTPGATLILFADGVEIGRWEASDVSIPLDLDVPSPPASITAQQQLCGHISPISRSYTAATRGSGRWSVVEDASGDNLKADAFAVHVGLAHSGKIVLFSGDQYNQSQNEAHPQDIDHAQLFDCQTLTIQKIDAPKTDVFCSGHAFLPDGRLVVAGGTERFPLPDSNPDPHHDHSPGLRNTWLFEPSTPPGGTFWSEAAPMQGGRWYPTLLTLRDGRVLALSGHPEEASGLHNNTTMEVFDPATGWTNLGVSSEIISAESAYLYPRLHVLPGGDVFSSSPMLSGQSGRWSPGSGTTWRDVSPVPRTYDGYARTAVLLPLLPDDEYRAMVAVAGDADSHIIDFGTAAEPNPAPSWKSLGRRSAIAAGRVRVECTAVILPTADVLIVGGVERHEDENSKVLDPELLRRAGPGAWQWSAGKLAAATVIRSYHSTAVLMPDGRVWTAGGNVHALGGGPSTRHLEVEIYEPWYCCIERPVIQGWPTAAHAGQRVLIKVWSKNPITRLALVRAASATHGFVPDQRYVGLSHVALESDDLYVGQVPGSDIAVPGYYLLFACTDKNVPSVGVFMQILP